MDSMDVMEVLDVTVRVPGSCGELLQGWHRGEPFLVTCPIARYTTVRAAASLQGLIGLGEKARCALQLYLREAGIEKFPFGMQLTSELPRGKGMASSSADIAAVLAAASQALGQPLAPEAILHLAVQVEPTDAVFLPGIVCLNQVTGRVQRVYRRLSHPYLTIFDTGGTVDPADCHACAAIARRARQPSLDGLARSCGRGREAHGRGRDAECALESGTTAKTLPRSPVAAGEGHWCSGARGRAQRHGHRRHLAVADGARADRVPLGTSCAAVSQSHLPRHLFDVQRRRRIHEKG